LEGGKLLKSLRPHCLRAEIAGSVRRRKTDVGDVEIVCIPRWVLEQDESNLFTEEQVLVNRVTRWAREDGTDACGIVWTPRPYPESKLLRGLHYPSGLRIELHLVPAPVWGMALQIRTGNAEFSKAFQHQLGRRGLQCRDLQVTRKEDGTILPTPEEADVFRLTGLEWVEPEARTGYASLRATCDRG